MWHFVADDAAKDEVGIKSLLLRAGDFAGHLEVPADIRDIPYPAVVLLGYYLHVPRRLRMYIQERQEIRILVYDLRGDFFCDNFAEYAI